MLFRDLNTIEILNMFIFVARLPVFIFARAGTLFCRAHSFITAQIERSGKGTKMSKTKLIFVRGIEANERGMRSHWLYFNSGL